jgi:hypothetical protein
MENSRLPVASKYKNLDTTFSLDLAQDLLSNEEVASATILSLYPSTPASALSCAVSATSTSSVSLSLVGGQDNTVYKASIRVVLNSSRTLLKELVINVLQHGATSFDKHDPYAYRDLVGSVTAGESVHAACHFVMQDNNIDTQDLLNGFVSWDFIDNVGRLLASGNTYSYTVNDTSFVRIVQASALINLPSDILPSDDGNSYTLRWSLILNSGYKEYQSESVSVLGSVSTVPLGAVDTVDLSGDNITLFAVTRTIFDSVVAEVYKENSKVRSLTPTIAPEEVSSGFMYSVSTETADIPAALEPYAVSWKFFNRKAPHIISRETSKLFLVTPSMLMAIEDAKARVSKARTTLIGADDSLFDTSTIMTWLARGRDDFNAAGNMATFFTMTNATGVIRSLWLQYSEIAMLRAQALLEGESAFEFSGQAISLNVDRSSHYSSLADALQSQADATVAGIKKNLAMRGINGGEGNVTGGSNHARIGISLHQASPYPRAGYYSR